MNKTIKSIALLKVIYESNKDYIDIFIPFIATLISKLNYSSISVEIVCTDFEREYGLSIPYHPMQTILRRAKTRGLIKIEDGNFVPNRDQISKFDISSKSFEKAREIDSLINKFIAYSKDTFSKDFPFKVAEQIFISYLKENEKDILIASQDISLLPDVDSSKERKYIINRYIKHIYDKNYTDYKLITQIISGYTLANCIFFDEPNNFRGKIKGIKIFLDTRIMLRLVGLEGKFREDSYFNFIKFLKGKGVIFSIFDHTLEEINGIIEDCVNWINNPHYNPSLASPVLRYFMENNYDKESVRLFIPKIESFIEFNDIVIEAAPDPNDLIDFQINESQLFEIIKELYYLSNSPYENISKDAVIYKDVKSISAIYKIRKGKKPNYLKGSSAIFVTTNAALAKANYLYNVRNDINDHCIKECLTDVFLGTIIWSDNPAKFNEFNERKIIANCIAALAPDESLLVKYTKELDRLEKDKRLTPNELYFMKTHKTISEQLVEKTFNDDDNFYDKLPEEIFYEIKNSIELESLKKVNEEKQKHLETQSILENTKKDLDKSVLETDSIKSKNIQYEIQINNFSKAAAKWIIRILFCIILPLLFSAYAFYSFPNLISNQIIMVWSIIIVHIIDILSIIFGCSIKGFLKGFESYLKIHIRNIILRERYSSDS